MSGSLVIRKMELKRSFFPSTKLEKIKGTTKRYFNSLISKVVSWDNHFAEQFGSIY
jgi:hypothetical protein